MLDKLENLDNILEEIQILKKRSKLLDTILNHYNQETMIFDIKAKWHSRIVKSKLPAESPRHHLKNKINEVLDMELDYNMRKNFIEQYKEH